MEYKNNEIDPLSVENSKIGDIELQKSPSTFNEKKRLPPPLKCRLLDKDFLIENFKKR